MAMANGYAGSRGGGHHPITRHEKRDGESSWSIFDFFFYNDLSEIVYNRTILINYSKNDLKLLSVYEMSFKFVKGDESALYVNVLLHMRIVQ